MPGIVGLRHCEGASGVGVAAISSNDAQSYPEDAPDRMAVQAKTPGYTFPYLYDETQEIVRAFNAVCTPDLCPLNKAGRFRAPLYCYLLATPNLSVGLLL
jgi:hypothetical protein